MTIIIITMHTHTVTYISILSMMVWCSYNSIETVWVAGPKDVVYMSSYVTAFTADTVASNGFNYRFQIIAVHLLFSVRR